MWIVLVTTLAVVIGLGTQSTALPPQTAGVLTAPSVSASSAGSKMVGLRTYTWGSVNESGVTAVWTEVRLPSGTWSRSQTGSTDTQGSYVLELTYGWTTPGTYEFRVAAATSSGTVYSPPFTLSRTPWTVSTAGTKSVGATTNVWGSMPSAANRTVWTQALVGGRWSTSQTRTADGSGYLVIPLTYGSNAVGRYTFRVGASTPLGTVYSEPFELTRTAVVEAHTAGTKPVNQVTNTWGTVRGYGGGQVWTQVLVGGAWSTSQTRTASGSGYFVIPLTYGSSTPGTYTFRVVAATPVGLAHSPSFTLTRTQLTASEIVERWRGQDIEAFPTTRKVVALTFDGGASNTAVDRILDTLDANNVPATFFVTGQFARAYPSAVRAMADGGHPVGNHSNTHPHFPQLTDSAIRAELAAAESSIVAVTGRPAAPLFRFPFGDRTSADIRVVNNAGYVPIRWSVDSLGWQGTSGGITTGIIRQRVLNTLRPGGIVLMHVGAHPQDGSTLDADALQGVIDDLRVRGYGFVTVSDLLTS